MHAFRTTFLVAAFLSISLSSACSKSTSTDSSAADDALRRTKKPPPNVQVVVSPASAQVPPSGTATFTATVTGTSDTSVVWSVVEGAACGAISSAGVYTAPATPATCHVLATSHADPAHSATGTADVAAPTTTTTTTPPAASTIAVAVTPANGTVDACKTLALSAAVTGTANGAVTWAVQEGSAGGTVSSAGVYTAPSSAGTYHAVATSVADTTKTAVATIVVTDRIVSVAVTPATGTVASGGAKQFTATITTTCGSFASTGVGVAQ